MKKIALMMSLVAVSAQGYVKVSHVPGQSWWTTGKTVHNQSTKVAAGMVYMLANQAFLRTNVRGKIATFVDGRINRPVLNTCAKVLLTSVADSTAMTASIYLTQDATTFTPKSMLAGFASTAVANAALSAVETCASKTELGEKIVTHELYQSWVRPVAQYGLTGVVGELAKKVTTQTTRTSN